MKQIKEYKGEIKQTKKQLKALADRACDQEWVRKELEWLAKN